MVEKFSEFAIDLNQILDGFQNSIRMKLPEELKGKQGLNNFLIIIFHIFGIKFISSKKPILYFYFTIYSSPS